MQKLILTQTAGFKGYLPHDCTGNTIHYLGYFIIDVWIENLNEYIMWAQNPLEEFFFMNVAFLEKDENSEDIFIGSQLSDQENWGPFYKISIKQFIELLPQWKKLVEAKVETITIIDNNGILEITGS